MLKPTTFKLRRNVLIVTVHADCVRFALHRETGSVQRWQDTIDEAARTLQGYLAQGYR